MTASLAEPSYTYDVTPSPEVCQRAGAPINTTDWSEASHDVRKLWAVPFPEIKRRFDPIYGKYPLTIILTARLESGELAGAMQVGLPQPGAETPTKSGSLHINAVRRGTPVWGRLREYPGAIAGLPFNWGLTPDVHINVVNEELRGDASPNFNMQLWLARTALAIFDTGERAGLVTTRQEPGIITSFVARYLVFMKANYDNGVEQLGPPSRYGGNKNKAQSGVPDKTWTTLAALHVRQCLANDRLGILRAEAPEIDKVVAQQQPIIEAIYGRQ